MTRRPALAALIALTGCGPAAAPRTLAVIRAPVALSAPPGPGASGELVGAVERGDALYLFARDRVMIERGGEILATAAAPPGGWADAVAMPALEPGETRRDDRDGSAGGIDDPDTWVVGRTAAGALWRVTATGDLEPIHDRLGLPPGARAIAAGPATAAIALDDGVAVLRDPRHLARFSDDAPRGPAAIAAGADRIAIRRGDAVEVWGLAAQRRVAYTVPGAIAAAFTGARRDQLAVATPDALYLEDAGRLRRIAAPAPIRGLAAAGSRLWVVTRSGVALLDGGALVPAAVQVAATDHVFGLADGDAVLAGRGGATRLSLAPDADPRDGVQGGPRRGERGREDPLRIHDEARWRAAVAPIVRRVCSRCHDPGGRGGVDLSTFAAWRSERGALIRRVLDVRSMPPAGTDLDDADRRALAGWLLAGHAPP